MKLKAILLDVDGVLLDSIPNYIEHMKKIAKAMKLRIPSEKEFRFIFGLPYHQAVEKLWPDINFEKYEQVDAEVENKYPLKIRAFKNAVKSIGEIKKKGVKVGIVTMGKRGYLTKKLTDAGYNLELFECMVTSEDVGRPRPYPDALLLACKKLKIKPKNALYIGDTLLDYESAERAKVNYCSVTCGTLSEDVLAENGVVNRIRDITELPKLINNNELFFARKTVSCFVIFNNKLLLLKRSGNVNTYPNKWSVIHGRIEEGEDPKKRAMKELKEETGLNFKSIKQRKTFTLRDNKYDIIWHIYPFIVEAKTNKVKLNWEHTSYEWINPKDIKKYDTVPNLWKSVNEILKK